MDKAEYWREQISLQDKSGLTRKSYCESHDLNSHTFTYWKQKLIGSKIKSKKNFIPVKIKGSSTLKYELELPSGHKIKFSSGFNVRDLKEIMDLVK